MIIRRNANMLRLLTTLKGSIAKHIALRVLMLTALSALIVLIESLHPDVFYRMNATPFTLLGISLSIFMSFRNNTCYDRWWEGRKAWGRIVVDVRSFIRGSIVIGDTEVREGLLRALCGYSHALNAKLRHNDELKAAVSWLPVPVDVAPVNLSDWILRGIGEKLAGLAKNNEISNISYLILEQRLESLTDAQGVCERIKETPLPFPYTLLLHRTTFIFCLLLPFAIAEPLGWISPLITAIVAYTFFGLDVISNQLEEPFGCEENDLPLDAIVRIIEREISEALGYPELPPLLKPVDFVIR